MVQFSNEKSDTNNGMFLGGTDILGFSTAGTSRLTIAADGTVNVLDVVSTVNYILAGGDGLDECGEASADYNQDGTVNVLDVVSIVNLILSGGGRAADAAFFYG